MPVFVADQSPDAAHQSAPPSTLISQSIDDCRRQLGAGGALRVRFTASRSTFERSASVPA